MFALVLSALVASIAGAAPVSFERVQELAGGIASSVQVSYASGAAVKLAQAVSPTETTVFAVAPTNSPDTAFYVVDRGSTGGFVVMSADDRLDPVLVIAPTGKFDATPGTPLYDILCGDVTKRIAIADREGISRSEGWRRLLEFDDSRAQSIAYAGLSSISDVRVEPLVKSQWNQSYVDGKEVYNYYTPNNYVCGCVATAGSQIMRFHEYPKGKVTGITRTCYVDGSPVSRDMYGGTYDWNNMPLVPTSAITETECKAIGKLCYDVGVSIYMSWAAGGSGTGGYCLKDAFINVFKYKNAVAYQLYYENIPQSDIENLMLANFDAGYPVEVSIDGSAGGHSIVGDGYGYQNGSLYIHLNMGWGGGDDAWYHLPSIGTWAGFNMVDGVVYNIFPDWKGDLLTGRVTDFSTGAPISGATVKAYDGSTLAGTAMTGSSGIYALRLSGGKTYSVVAGSSGAEDARMDVYLKKSMTTTTSGRSFYPNTGTIGNSWGNDFVLTVESDPVKPDAPSGVSATEGTSTAEVRVTWSASAGATYYKVYRNTSNSPSAASCIASSVKKFYYDDTSAEVGTTYYYWVVAGNAAGESGYSALATGWRAYGIPAAPTGVSATDGTSTESVTVSWNVASHATSYSVWRSTSSATSSAVSIATKLTSTTYVDTTAIAGQTYYYWVKATNSTGTSDFSTPDAGSRAVAKPSAPTGVSASDGLSASEIVVSWSAVSTATSYSVWRGTSSSSSEALQIASGLTVTTYSDTTASAGNTYYYWVRATNSGGTSSFSASDTGCLANIVGPSTVSASDGTYVDYVRVTWASSSGAISYEVWRAEVNAYSQASCIVTATSTAYNDSTAAVGTRYYYWVKAVTANGTSGFSSSDFGYRPIAVPTGVSATRGNAVGVNVTWPAVVGATSYQIGRGAEGASVPSETSLGSTTTRSFIDTTAVPGETYTYFVRAVASSCGYTTGWSSPATGSRSVPTPTELTATDGTYTDRILVSWPALSGATSYELKRWTEDDIDSAELLVTTNATSFSDTTVAHGVTYYYWLRANFVAGTSNWSESESGMRAFPKPQNVSATDGESTYGITVSWSNIDGAAHYQVWRYSEARRRNELIGTTSYNSHYDSNGIVPGTLYRYYVKAVFANGTSALSDSDTGYVKASSPTVSASDGISTNQISLTWTEAPGAITYRVYRGTSPDYTSATSLGSTSMRYWYDTKASKGVLYYYWVVAVTAIDTSGFTGADTGYIALPSVSHVSASDGDYSGFVRVSWRSVPGATSYEVWRGTSADYANAANVMSGISGLSWDDGSVTPGEKNWYWVRACDAGGTGLLGASDSGWRTFSTPANMTASTNRTDGILVSWNATSWGVSFEIRRSETDDFDGAETVATVSDMSDYTDNTAVAGKKYYYWICAYSDIAESAWSASASGWRAVASPAVSATDGTSLDKVTVTWTAATSAMSYEIWRSDQPRSEFAEQIGTTNKLVWVDSNVVPGILYYYWVKSISAIDTSAFESYDSGYVSTLPPTGVVASDGASLDGVSVTWEASDGANSYDVWRAESDDVESAFQIAYNELETAYDDMTAVPGKYYWYWVRPVSDAGAGVFAGPDRGHRALAAPSDVVASSDNDANVTLRWGWSEGATYYEIFRAETNCVDEATNSVFATATSTYFSDTNAVPTVKYWYWVRAVAEADVSSFGGPANGYRLMSPPADVSASDGNFADCVKVIWSESTSAASYEVWRAINTTSTLEAEKIAEGVEGLEYLDETALAGVLYVYWVKAVSELHTTDFRSNDWGWRSLPAPDSINASDGVSTESVDVSWSEVPGALEYEIWRSDGETSVTDDAICIYKTVDGSVKSYSDTSAEPGVSYTYWVRAVVSPGSCIFGAFDSGFRALAPSSYVNATDGSLDGQVYVEWYAVAGATHYRVYRADSDESEKTPLSGWLTERSFTDVSCIGERHYFYYVLAAIDENGSRSSTFSAGNEGFAKSDVVEGEPVDFGGGISWPVIDNGDGTMTTNAISFASIEDGRLAFSGVYGLVGSTTTVQALVKTSLDSESVYTIPTTLKIVSAGTAELDLSEVWGAHPSLFVLGITTEAGEVLP